MYAYRKTAVKAPCLASIKSNLPALRAAEHSFVVCPNSRPMTLWRSKGPEPNSVHFIHTEACGLYYGSLEFQHRDASLSLSISPSLTVLAFFLILHRVHETNYTLGCWRKVRYSLYKAEHALFFL